MGKKFDKSGKTQKLGIIGLYDKAAQTRQDNLNKALGDDLKRRPAGKKRKSGY